MNLFPDAKNYPGNLQSDLHNVYVGCSQRFPTTGTHRLQDLTIQSMDTLIYMRSKRYETGYHIGVYFGNLTEAVDEVAILAGLLADIYFSVHADKLEVNRRVVTHYSEARGSWFISNTEYLPDQVKEEIQQAL
nr:NADPH--cytochrome P450 reductase-like [Tanacetum cinerariifolium]